MTSKQALQIIGVLTAAYPRTDIQEETVEIFSRFLLDLPYEVGQMAALKLIGESKWFPSVAELRQGAIEVASTNQLPSAAEAWGEVKNQMRFTGYYGTPSFSHSLITKTVEAFGWQGLCVSENIIADRAHFLKIYESYRTRELREAVEIPEIRALRDKVKKELAV